jgi:hypothetical protein
LDFAAQSNSFRSEKPFESKIGCNANPTGSAAGVNCSQMSESAPSEEPTRLAPLPLWQAAHALVTALFNLFGDPEDIAAQRTLTKRARELLLSWLRPTEAILRRLIFIEASKLGLDGPRAFRPASAHTKSASEDARSDFDPAAPEAWRVSFRCSVSTRRASHPRSKRHRAPRAIYARPLAERCEALLRAFNDPAPFARRLARRLNRTNARRVHDEPPANTRDLYGHESFDTLDFHYRAAFHGIDTG